MRIVVSIFSLLHCCTASGDLEPYRDPNYLQQQCELLENADIANTKGTDLWNEESTNFSYCEQTCAEQRSNRKLNELPCNTVTMLDRSRC